MPVSLEVQEGVETAETGSRGASGGDSTAGWPRLLKAVNQGEGRHCSPGLQQGPWAEAAQPGWGSCLVEVFGARGRAPS